MFHDMSSAYINKSIYKNRKKGVNINHKEFRKNMIKKRKETKMFYIYIFFILYMSRCRPKKIHIYIYKYIFIKSFFSQITTKNNFQYSYNIIIYMNEIGYIFVLFDFFLYLIILSAVHKR